jgi:REP element-mobilizing transposase RayT
VFVEGGIYHVYNRFARGAELFSDPEEAIEFCEILRKVAARDELRFFAWTLMSNHYHLALRAGPVPLSRTMGYVQARFGQGYNRRHGSSGPRWQSRYKAKLVETPESFNRLVVYIHLNPVVAGLVEDPADYVFSGHRELLGKVRDPLIDVEGVLAEFGDTVRQARKLYVRSLKGERDEEWQGERPGKLPWWGREVDRPVEPVSPPAWIDELGRSTGLERQPMAPDDFVACCCSILGVSFDEVLDRGKGRSISRTRYLIAALAIERWKLSAKQLGELLARWPEAVSRWASRGAEMRMNTREFREDFEALDQALAARFKDGLAG